MTVFGRPSTAIQIGHNDALKAYRQKGIYFHMSEIVINEIVLREPIEFCFGVAIDETRDLSTVFMEFEDAGRLERFVRVVNPFPHLRRKVGIPLPSALGAPARALARQRSRRALRGAEVVPVTYFDETFNRAWRQADTSRIMTTRDAAYLQWRYCECPGVDYRIRRLASGDAMMGWTVTHSFMAEGIHYGVIDECFSCQSDAVVQQQLVQVAVNDALENGADAIVAWGAPGTPLVDALRGSHFIARAAPRSWIVRRLQSELPVEKLATQDHWYYAIGDSEYWIYPVEGRSAADSDG